MSETVLYDIQFLNQYTAQKNLLKYVQENDKQIEKSKIKDNLKPKFLYQQMAENTKKENHQVILNLIAQNISKAEEILSTLKNNLTESQFQILYDKEVNLLTETEVAEKYSITRRQVNYCMQRIKEKYFKCEKQEQTVIHKKDINTFKILAKHYSDNLENYYIVKLTEDAERYKLGGCRAVQYDGLGVQNGGIDKAKREYLKLCSLEHLEKTEMQGSIICQYVSLTEQILKKCSPLWQPYIYLIYLNHYKFNSFANKKLINMNSKTFSNLLMQEIYHAQQSLNIDSTLFEDGYYAEQTMESQN